MTTSSAVPDDLDDYVRSSQALNDTLKLRLGRLEDLHEAVAPRLRWGGFDASAVIEAARAFVRLNDEDDEWVAAWRGPSGRPVGTAVW